MIYNGGLECKISKLLPCVVACKPDSPLVCGAVVVVVVLNSVKKKEAILIIQQSKLTESYQETELTVS